MAGRSIYLLAELVCIDSSSKQELRAEKEYFGDCTKRHDETNRCHTCKEFIDYNQFVHRQNSRFGVQKRHVECAIFVKLITSKEVAEQMPSALNYSVKLRERMIRESRAPLERLAIVPKMMALAGLVLFTFGMLGSLPLLS